MWQCGKNGVVDNASRCASKNTASRPPPFADCFRISCLRLITERQSMNQRFRLYRRKRGGRFYVHDNITGKQLSLKTSDRTEALRVLHAKNEAEKQPAINLQIARAYLAAGDPDIATRTWQVAMDAVVKLKQGSTRERWQAAVHDKALEVIRRLPILETRPEHFLRVLELGTVATNVYLRRLHNFALAVTWLPWPVLNKQQWPRVRFKEKRGITADEHRTVLTAERNPERKAFFELALHLGAAQGDLATLRADNIDWESRIISFRRKKTGTVAVLRFGEDVAAVLNRLPTFGPLFPNLSRLPSTERASIFRLRCQALCIEGVTLHSYRYAWAERARKCGYPERFAKEALGHESNAVHWAYAKKAKVEAPPLEEYEKLSANQRVVRLRMQTGTPVLVEPDRQHIIASAR